MAKPMCGDCRYFHREHDLGGLCRFNPPAILVVPQPDKSFGHTIEMMGPKVAEIGWCGRFQKEAGAAGIAPLTHSFVRSADEIVADAEADGYSIGLWDELVSCARDLLDEQNRIEREKMLPQPEPAPDLEDQIRRKMAERFLAWRLPDDFNPDGGIFFNPDARSIRKPVGTNLFTYTQARAMIDFMHDGGPDDSALIDDQAGS